MLILIFVHAKIILPRSFSLLLANLILACIFVSRSYMSVDRFGTLMLILVYMWKPKYFMWPSWNLKFLSRNLTLRWAQLGFYLIMLSSRIKIQFCGISMKLHTISREIDKYETIPFQCSAIHVCSWIGNWNVVKNLMADHIKFWAKQLFIVGFADAELRYGFIVLKYWPSSWPYGFMLILDDNDMPKPRIIKET